MNLSCVWLDWDQLGWDQAWAETKPIDTVGYRHCKKLLWDQSLKIYIKNTRQQKTSLKIQQTKTKHTKTQQTRALSKKSTQNQSVFNLVDNSVLSFWDQQWQNLVQRRVLGILGICQLLKQPLWDYKLNISIKRPQTLS